MIIDKTKIQISEDYRKPAVKYKQISGSVEKTPYYYELLLFDVIQKKSVLNGF